MFAEYWPVGATDPGTLPMTTRAISAHLTADWIPSLPSAVGSSFIGWPPFLLENILVDGNSRLALKEISRRSERQWKAVLSWMLGVAGTRCVLAEEGYRWIAPLSAFYEETAQGVDLSNWNSMFPPTALTATKPAGNRSRLRPDYVALRPTSSPGPLEWAVVESKGTHRCLSNLRNCRSDWYAQARNIELSFNENPITVQRHIVVATRVNPNAAASGTRRLQVRAWNSRTDHTENRLPPKATVEIAAASVFGIFKNLGLIANARAIAFSIRRLNQKHTAEKVRSVLTASSVSETAEEEMRQRLNTPAGSDSSMTLRLDTQAGPVTVMISDSLFDFARKLRVLKELEDGAGLLRETDSRLDAWERSEKEQIRHGEILLPFGVHVQLPEAFGTISER